MDGFVEIGKLEQFREDRARIVHVDRHCIVVFRIGDDLFAIQEKCPHMGASLADGKVSDGQVRCSWHGWKFDLESGQSSARPWARVETYRTEIVDGTVYVERPTDPRTPTDPPREQEDEWTVWDPKRHWKKDSE